MNETLKQFDSPLQNNSREIVRRKLEKMKTSPSEMTAQQLEKLGITVDWSDKDYGEPPKKYEN